ncbi:MAG: hypothetical protein ACRBBS_15940 [Thalassovita sp.]
MSVHMAVHMIAMRMVVTVPARGMVVIMMVVVVIVRHHSPTL